MSDQTERPEKLPTGLAPPKQFLVDLSLTEDAKKENQLLINSYESRIDKIIDAFTINDQPVIKFILQMTHDKDELKNLAKGLDRVADLQEVLDELQQRQGILEYVEKDPTWFAAALADLASEVDTHLTNEQLEDLLK